MDVRGEAALPEHRRTDMVSPEPRNHWIVLLDIEDFSLRPDVTQATLHDELYKVVEFALERAGLDLTRCAVQDRGDGMMILAPAETSPTRLLREFVRALDDALEGHRATYNEDHRMRLRVGVHLGLVIRQDPRWTGTAINDLARLVDARPVKDVLARARRAHLVLVVSEEVHKSVVLGRYPGIDLAAYVPADFVTKHDEARRGWVTVPRYAAPPGVSAGTAEPRREGEEHAVKREDAAGSPASGNPPRYGGHHVEGDFYGGHHIEGDYFGGDRIAGNKYVVGDDDTVDES
ncbi:nucleotidyl cyclase domain-containing protein [Streptomyces fulvoviolaceus]|uniref:hypothetical protein n=1 Tax=Streptomyces fulvoviolaceus TaxID=285535 RepID=UPI0021C0BAC0|nr:hypothetical protein [Streptomyces fulvoviolaceus]MCT9080114.1 hypothetical protein [Streptomyces fulvoviolaceus]